MTFFELRERLSELGSADPRSEAFALIEHFFGAKPADIIAFRERDYSSRPLEEALCKRADGTPLQYITQTAYFYNLKLKVTPACLIPRFDTELLCDTLIQRLPQNARFLEFCTGSGCIPLAVISNRSDTSAKTIELYPKTAELAAENRKLCGISEEKLEILCGDALSYSDDERYDAIVSNPPYIKSSVIPTLSREVAHEPAAALDGGVDGLVFYRKFLSDYKNLLKPNGFFAFEIGYDQENALTELAGKNGMECEVICDYGKNPRVCIIKQQISAYTE